MYMTKNTGSPFSSARQDPSHGNFRHHLRYEGLKMQTLEYARAENRFEGDF
jgi:hypothetical protein